MDALPIDQVLPELSAALARNNAAVLVAPPGAGKSTRVPPALLREPWNNTGGRILMLQPRRIAARTVAARIAQENRWVLGREVGYHVRFDRVAGPATRIEVITEGILTRRLLHDPFMEGIAAVLLDEFHERSIHSDLALAFLREVQTTVHEQLRVVVMSATLDPLPISRYLGNCPIITAHTATHPVAISHRPAPPAAVDMTNHAAQTAIELLQEEPTATGDVLVFLPGVREIQAAAAATEAAARSSGADVLQLYGAMPLDQQQRAVQPGPGRRIIFATNIAETSLTIPGVRTVVDSGLARVAGFDADRGLDRLTLQRISRAAADQRAGRAGRIGPGRAIRLWSVTQERDMAAFDLPEIARLDLASTVLMLHAWGHKSAHDFRWLTPPPEGHVAAAEELLFLLGALTSEQDGQITDRGRHMARLPLHPRLGRLALAAADQGLHALGATLAALFSEGATGQPLATSAPGVARSDVLALLEEFLAGKMPASRAGEAAAVRRVRDDLLRMLEAPGEALPRALSPLHENSVLRWTLLAYPDRVCRRRENDPRAGVMVGGTGVRLSGSSQVLRDSFFVAVAAHRNDQSRRGESSVYAASAIEEAWLEEEFPQAIVRQRTLRMDEKLQRVVEVRTICYRDLPLRSVLVAPTDAAAAAAVFADYLTANAAEVFAADEAAARFLSRVRFLRKQVPAIDLPDFTPELLRQVALDACPDCTSVDSLRRLGLASILRQSLQRNQALLLDREAPEKLLLPRGKHAAIDYSDPDRPTLAARIQELFGWPETPRLAQGRVPLLLHLLGPNYRPVQVTSDLASFWRGAYQQVRKDLRARYPRHAWPENPHNATA